jgi:hypothetical protein
MSVEAQRIKELEEQIKLLHLKNEADVAKARLEAAEAKASGPANFKLMPPREFKHPSFSGDRKAYGPFKEYLLEFFSTASITDEKEKFDTLKAHVAQPVWASFINKPTGYNDFISRLDLAYLQPVTQWSLIRDIHCVSFSGDYQSYAMEVLRKLATLEKFLVDHKRLAYLKCHAEDGESDYTTLARLLIAGLPEEDAVRIGLNNLIKGKKAWTNESEIIRDISTLADANIRPRRATTALVSRTVEELEEGQEEVEEEDDEFRDKDGTPQQQTLAFDSAYRTRARGRRRGRGRGRGGRQGGRPQSAATSTPTSVPTQPQPPRQGKGPGSRGQH